MPSNILKSFITKGGTKYCITRNSSIFTDRNNKHLKLDDCIISVMNPNNYGAREEDGNYYSICAMLACESGNILRSHIHYNPEITLEWLKAHDFID